MPGQLLFLEFNEINFESISFYCSRGLLPNLNALISGKGWATTLSEEKYEEIEPWIQWVTAHTGKRLAEHGVFRLGDIVKHDFPQIWEQLEAQGLKVGAISPMNAKHRLRSPAFFVPDPWTTTDLTAPPRLRGLYNAIVQAVNDNAQARLTLSSLWQLLWGCAAYARPVNYHRYVRMAATARARPWRKAIVLDLLLSDVFFKEMKRTSPHFATLFVNAGAHIQHHYLFSSASYSGPHRNPEWYLQPGLDPVREVYEAYDHIYGEARRLFPDARIMIATGLHQEPHGSITYYWRLCRHSEFLKKIGVRFKQVEPRMSRDFLVICASPAEAAHVNDRLSRAVAEDGMPLFEVDNRGTDLFVMLTYSREIRAGLPFRIGEERFVFGADDVAFVALKNGEHSGVGYFLDTASQFKQGNTTFSLTDIPERIMEAFGVTPAAQHFANAPRAASHAEA